MAFMTVATSSGGGDGGDRLPILKYDARAGRIFTLDRVQNGDAWETVQTDITMKQPAFAVDFGSLEVGHAYFSAGQAPQWAVAYFGQPMPARPASPGDDDKGKPLSFKPAFRVRVVGQGIGGVREFGGNSNAFINGMNVLHTAFEAAPEATAGKIPVVKLTDTLPIKSGQSTNYAPVFTIVQWVDRPGALGVRAVPPPASAPKAAARPANHVPPPTQAPVLMTEGAGMGGDPDDALPF